MNSRIQEIYFNTSDFKNTGKHTERRYCCPFCADRGYHLYYDMTFGLYYCFKCGAKGRIKRIDDLSVGLGNVENVDTEKEFKPKEKVIVDVVGNSFIQKMALKYWKSRGLKKSELRKFDVKLNTVALSLLFPVYDENGIHIFDIQRKIYASDRPYYIDKFSEKKKYLYNLHQAKEFKTIYICEGVFDVISVGRNAVGLLGKVLTNEMVAKLEQTKAKKLVVLLDVDAKKDSWSILQRLHSIRGKRIGILSIGNTGYKDIAELRQYKGKDAVRKFIKGEKGND